jgi:hypothetical protein
MSARLHVPRLRINVARDFFVGLSIALVVVLPMFFVIFVARSSSLFIALAAEHPNVPYSMLMAVFVVFGLVALVSLAATLLGDPGLLATPTMHPDGTVEEHREEDEAHYCRACCAYIAKYDHHCGVVGACIGGRTMWSFILFLGSAGMFAAVGMVIVLSFLYAQLRGIESLSIHQVSSHMTPTALATCACVVAAFQGGLYATLMCGVYIVHVIRGTDSVARRHPQHGQRSTTLPQSWSYRLQRCFGHALTWRSAYSAQCEIDRGAAQERTILVAAASV